MSKNQNDIRNFRSKNKETGGFMHMKTTSVIFMSSFSSKPESYYQTIKSDIKAFLTSLYVCSHFIFSFGLNRKNTAANR